MAIAWIQEEVEAIVADYFLMLQSELRGESYNKTAHRKALLKILSGRSEGSIERKHMNISAVLQDLGHPWIDGYKPYGNYQQLLFDVVETRLDADEKIITLVQRSISDPIESPEITDLNSLWEKAPDRERSGYVSDSRRQKKPNRQPRRIDYLKLEARNQALGRAGEDLVLEYESARLYRAGKRKLARKIDHVSQTQGDGLGYDILSYDEDGKERLIEVKTTSYGKRTPFYVTRNELSCSVDRSEVYHLYRVFSFRKAPKLYGLQGRLDRCLDLDPVHYLARR
ncbi:MAG: DUF3883 domain-containing protein [Rhodothermales bacterium]